MVTVAIDVGGTFTDVLVMDGTGAIREFKAPTTPDDPSIGLLDGLRKAAAASQQEMPDFLESVDLLVHGTTLATNALLTRQGARVGMITTKGFRDIIEIRRGLKNVNTSMYNIFVPPYEPLVPRYLRLGVEERTRHTGEIDTPVNHGELAEALEHLAAEGVEAVAICFLHSYANTENEIVAAEIAHDVMRDAYVATSHDVLPVWREFERFSTTVVSAYVGPIVDRYLSRLERRLAEAGFKGTLLLVQSDGLVQSVQESRRRAVHLIASGPAAAPTAALHWGRVTGFNDVISVDMGGTSFDVSSIVAGEIPSTSESWIGEERIAIKVVEIKTVGAGGGSIGWIDSLGLLQVGPRSAGAAPGPACYGRGGREPTVTDADLVLGYVDPDYFLGGEIRLDRSLAVDALTRVGKRLGMDATQTATAMFETANTVMADEITEISTKRGRDVRDFTLVAGGGAGPIHAAAISELLGIQVIIIPRFAALYSAFGMLAMDLGRSYARTHVTDRSTTNVAAVNSLYLDMEREARAALGETDLAMEADGPRFTRTADIRYVGQFREVEVEIPDGVLTDEDLDLAVARFHRRHAQLYTFSLPGRSVEFLTFRLRATIPSPSTPSPPVPSTVGDVSSAQKGTRRCWFGDRYVESAIYAGERLPVGTRIDGPAIVEEATTAIAIPPTHRCTLDASGSYILRKAE